MDITTMRVIFTLLSFACFIGIAVWAFSRGNRERFEEAARLRDEIRRLEATELGLPDGERVAPVVGRSNEGKPGTRKGRFGKQGKTRWGR